MPVTIYKDSLEVHLDRRLSLADKVPFLTTLDKITLFADKGSSENHIVTNCERSSKVIKR